jgi:hypothetical protein
MEPPRSLAGSQAEFDAAANTQPSSVHPLPSKKVSDHLRMPFLTSFFRFPHAHLDLVAQSTCVNK